MTLAIGLQKWGRGPAQCHLAAGGRVKTQSLYPVAPALEIFPSRTLAIREHLSTPRSVHFWFQFGRRLGLWPQGSLPTLLP